MKKPVYVVKYQWRGETYQRLDQFDTRPAAFREAMRIIKEAKLHAWVEKLVS